MHIRANLRNFLLRGVAALLDILVSVVLFVIATPFANAVMGRDLFDFDTLQMFFTFERGEDEVANLWLNAASVAIVIVYKVITESSSWQASIGKKILRLVVTDEQGRRITAQRALGRNVVKEMGIISRIALSALFIDQDVSTLASIVSLYFFVDGLVILLTPKRQAIHDLVAGTLVTGEQKN